MQSPLPYLVVIRVMVMTPSSAVNGLRSCAQQKAPAAGRLVTRMSRHPGGGGRVLDGRRGDGDLPARGRAVSFLFREEIRPLAGLDYTPLRFRVGVPLGGRGRGRGRLQHWQLRTEPPTVRVTASVATRAMRTVCTAGFLSLALEACLLGGKQPEFTAHAWHRAHAGALADLSEPPA